MCNRRGQPLTKRNMKYIEKKFLPVPAVMIVVNLVAGWGERIRTFVMTGPKPVALPLGYSPSGDY